MRRLTWSGQMRVITSAHRLAEGANAPLAIQYLPAGKHTITATVDGSTQTVDIEVTEESAHLLQQSLEARQRDNVRPIVDFDHEDTGPAAAIPSRFYWQPGEGVMLALEWTGAGKRAVEGRDYSYFSPLFLMDDEGHPLGLHPQRPVGGLVNDPAFRSIRRIAAANAGLPSTNETEKEIMQHDYTPLVEAGVLSADQAKGEGVVTAIAAAFAKAAEEKRQLEAEKAAAESARDQAQSEIQAKREAEADAAIAKAVEAGRICVKDEDSKQFWRELVMEKGEPAVRQLEAKAAANPGIDKPVVTRSGGADTTANQQSVEAARAAQIRNRAAEIQAARNVPHSMAWNLAAAEIA